MANVFLMLSGQSFDYEGTVLYVNRRPYLSFSLGTNDMAATFRVDTSLSNFVPTVGQVLKVSGCVGLQEYDIPVNVVTNAICLATGRVPSPPIVTPDDIYAGKCDNRPVIITGIVRDVFRDEIDFHCVYLLLSADKQPVYGVLFTQDGLDIREFDPFIGRKVALTGRCEPYNRGRRRRINRMIHFQEVKSLQLLGSTTDETPIPDISTLAKLAPHELANNGRHSAIGRVLATWGKHEFLVKTTSNDLVKVQLASDSLPVADSLVSVVGLPNTDLYGYTLSRATWQSHPDVTTPTNAPTSVTLDRLLTDDEGHARPDTAFYGQTILVSGTVRGLPRPEAEEGRLYLEDNGFIVPVESSHAAKDFSALTIGSVIRVRAVCVLETDGVPSSGQFPHLRGLFLAISGAKDISVLSRPSWWTPGRLLAVIGTLALGLIGIVVWNLQLRRQSERRGRQLANERFAREASDLKVVERTRLAVELHDSMSQNLTGVSMEIRAAKRLAETDGKAMHGYLDLALKTIDSSRSELRNCIWDLRSRALEATTFDEAIRLTIGEHLGEAASQVRFNIPRERISDDVANAFLRIIRELVTNAVRHGEATQIRIAGSLDGDTLRFSVQDDGHGFDVKNCPGMGDGHFGLQGIRERVKALGGVLVLTSTPGHGTKAVVTLPLEQSRRT